MIGSDAEFVDFVVDQLEGTGGVVAKKMFGEYAVYLNDKIVALICDDRLLVKPTEAGREFIGDVVEGLPYPGAKPAFLIQDQIDDGEWLCELVRLTEKELPRPKPRKKKKKAT